VYYLISYLLTNLAAFGIVAIVNRSVGSDEISAYAGLSRRSPGLALALLVSLLSLGGIPPFAGFIGKFMVFGAAVQTNLIWLAIVGVLNSVISLYYYLTVLKVVYLYRSEDETKPVAIGSSRRVALLICVAGIMILGVIVAPWFAWSGQAYTAFLGY
jgi:NADH-quinone oxidoreductase subunit N